MNAGAVEPGLAYRRRVCSRFIESVRSDAYDVAGQEQPRDMLSLGALGGVAGDSYRASYESGVVGRVM
jgi:hypothetical protein